MNILKSICVLILCQLLGINLAVAQYYGGHNINVSSSVFYGPSSLVYRPTTGGQSAYNYSVHLMWTGEDTGNRYRAYVGGRWKSSLGDGDHIMQWTAEQGTPGTWSMWSFAPEAWQGQEVGLTGQWYSGEYTEPEVFKDPVSGTWVMYSQVEILAGTPTDTPGVTATIQADRILMFTGSDGKNWTRYQTHGAVTNITNPATTMFHHEEFLYVPWDPDGKVYWLYFALNVNGAYTGIYRIRSTSYLAYDYATMEQTAGFSDIGNQLGYLQEAPGGPLFTRITEANDGTGRLVPAMQYSTNGLWWSGIINYLAGSTDNASNKNCYFMGLSTIYGTGKWRYDGNNRWSAIYGASTMNSPGAPDVWSSEIGEGQVTISLDPFAKPVTLVTGTSNVTAVALFTNGTVQINAQTNLAGAWSGWQTIPGSQYVSHLDSTLLSSGRTAVFVVGSDTAVWWNVQTNSAGAWQGWQSLGGAGFHYVRSVRYTNDVLAVFGCGNGTAISVNAQVSPGGSWGGWQSIGGSGFSQLDPLLLSDGRAVCFAVGDATVPYINFQTAPNSSWVGWTSMGGATVSNVRGLLYPDGRLAVFEVGHGTDISCDAQYTAGGSWGGWQSIGGSNFTSMRPLQLPDGRFTCFAVGTSNAIFQSSQGAVGGAWGSWQSLGGTNLSTVDAALLPNGRLVNCGNAYGGGLMFNIQTATNGPWAGYTNLGGSLQ